jgi:hypothetical protein
VVVGGLGQPVPRLAGCGQDVDHAVCGEGGQRPVHGRDVDPGVALGDAPVDLGGAEMVGRLGEHGEYELPRGGAPVAQAPQPFEEFRGVGPV